MGEVDRHLLGFDLGLISSQMPFDPNHKPMVARLEAGMPGTGPLPVHLHAGKPTPWSEGCVFRFAPDTGDEWFGNLQPGFGYSTKTIEWSEARAVVVIAKGATYLVRPKEPHAWKHLDQLGVDCIISPTRQIALLSTYTDVVAVSAEGKQQWRRTVAIDGVEITRIEAGMIHGNACIDPPDEWRTFVLDLETGAEQTELR